MFLTKLCCSKQWGTRDIKLDHFALYILKKAICSLPPSTTCLTRNFEKGKRSNGKEGEEWGGGGEGWREGGGGAGGGGSKMPNPGKYQKILLRDISR